MEFDSAAAPDDDDEAESEELSSGVRGFLSLLLGLHFGAYAIVVLCEFNGPWPKLDGSGIGLGNPPAFISEGLADAARNYVKNVRLDETARFPSNRVQPLQVRLEAIVYDEKGAPMGAPLVYPNASSMPWNRAREQMIAQALANDVVKPNPGPDKLPPPGQEPTRVPVWRPIKPGEPLQHLTWVIEHTLTRAPDPPDWGPSEWGLTLSKSYAVYLCRATGAAAVELRRRWRYQPTPFMIQSESRPIDAREAEESFGERISTYGKVSDAEQR